MAASKRLIIGLGNPGEEYENTRHNVGFDVVDLLAEKTRASLSLDRGPSVFGWGRWRGRPMGLAKPLTYMNRSGQAVRGLMRRYGVELKNVLVIVDDLNLEPGRMRIRQKGSAGGHNGVQDIIDRLGSDDFPRLRIGIGRDFSRGRQADYVLTPFSASEAPLVEATLNEARDAALTFITDGIVTAMNRFNRK